VPVSQISGKKILFTLSVHTYLAEKRAHPSNL
jgi:hypothetical protein